VTDRERRPSDGQLRGPGSQDRGFSFRELSITGDSPALLALPDSIWA
jgi:hypothetical protein